MSSAFSSFCYGKKLPFIVTRDFCPSVVYRNNFGTRLCYIYWPIVFKLDLKVDIGVMKIWEKFNFENQIASCKFMQIKNLCKEVCAHGFDWSTNPILPKIDIHARYMMMHVWRNRVFLKSTWTLFFLNSVLNII